MPENCHITTIEKYEKRIPEAKENFRKAGEESRITFLEGDADMWLKELKGKQLETSSIVTIVQKVLQILLAVIILKEFVHLI